VAPPIAATDTSGPQTIRRVLDSIAARHGATIPQVTLAWLLARSPAILPIPATTSINHLQENLDAQDLDLTPRTSGQSTASSRRTQRPKHATCWTAAWPRPVSILTAKIDR
jgi:aryl-alcohol dehydrogenase-like predicted oxidoreductase